MVKNITEIYTVKSGKPTLVSKSETTMEVPPDILALKMLFDNEPLTNEQLKIEVQELSNLLRGKQ